VGIVTLEKLCPSSIVFRIKINDAAKLQDEYAKLVEGLQETMDVTEDSDVFMANPRKCSNFILLWNQA